TTGAFDKSLLQRVEVRSGSGQLFYAHDFEYYDEVGWGNSQLNLFDAPVVMENTEEIKTILIGPFVIGSIGGSTSSGLQVQGSAGFSPFNWVNALSIGPDGSAAENTTHTQIQLIDIDGDGMPDQVYKEGEFDVKYRRNKGDNQFDNEVEIPGLCGLGKDESRTITKGVGANVYMVGKKRQWSNTNAFTKEYFTDVNGDGYVDFINGSTVYFNHSYTGTVYFSTTPPAGFVVVQEEVNVPVNPIDEGQEDEGKYDFMDMFYRDNPVIAWRAPFSGRIAIEGDVSFVQEINSYIQQLGYTGADGVRVTIEKPGDTQPLWSSVIDRNGSVTPSINELWVNAGDYILFRVDSKRDGAYDEIIWNPQITYKGYVNEAVDENNMYIYQYKLADDFYVNGGGIFEPPFAGVGTIKGGRIYKYAKTSDNISYKIIKRDVTQTILIGDNQSNPGEQVYSPAVEILSGEIEAGYVGQVNIGNYSNILITKHEEKTYDGDKISSITVTKTILECRMDADTPIDWRQVQWMNDDGKQGPQVQYTDIVLPEGQQMNENDMQSLLNSVYRIPVNTKLFTVPLTAGNGTGKIDPYVFEGWNIPREGNYRVVITAIYNGDNTYNEDLTLCVKKRISGGGFIADVVGKRGLDKEIGLEKNQQLELDTIENDILECNEGDELYFVITATKPEWFSFDVTVYYDICSTNPWVDDRIWVEIPVEYCIYKSVDPGKDIIFAGGFRNWYYGRWNADEFVDEEVAGNPDYIYDYELKDIKQSYLKVDYEEVQNDPEGFAEKIKLCSPMIPKFFDTLGDGEQQIKDRQRTTELVLPCWQGMDADSWIGLKVENGKKNVIIATTRLIKKNIEDLLHPEQEVGNQSTTQSVTITQIQNAGTVDRRGVSKYTRSYSKMDSLSAGLSYATSKTKSITKRQFFDINGDRYPDIVTDAGAVVTNIMGGLYKSLSFLQGAIQYTEGKNTNWSINPQTITTMAVLCIRGNGILEKVATAMPSMTLTRATSSSKVLKDLVDINGDGLPDKIECNDSGCVVLYNTGNGVVTGQVLPITAIQKSELQSISASDGTGFSIDKSFYSGGISISDTSNDTGYILMDINGDGMPDKIHDNGKIYFYNGQGFATIYKQTDAGLDRTRGQSVNLSATAGGKLPVFIPIPFALIFIGTIEISGGGGGTMDGNATRYTLRDINGDGLPDIVYQSGDPLQSNSLYVRLNRTGKTNMLKSIKNSIGGTIELDYKRVGNTRLMPQSQWVLATVTTDDGTSTIDPTPGSVHRYTTNYDYADGVQDR
ncbi:MAG TPA: toxin TcdB middle/N-terminal domain-containing protein, partial [Spirochaetota bacterium]|nr:toxin TcdB middle/N-terminal domain-containing protein [Spirochaetota bacterium]